MELNRKRLVQDEVYSFNQARYNEIFTFLSPEDESNQELPQRFASILLLQCYHTISPKYAKTLLENKDSIDSLTEQNKKLIDLDKWEDLFKRMSNADIDAELRTMSSSIQELKDPVD